MSTLISCDPWQVSCAHNGGRGGEGVSSMAGLERVGYSQGDPGPSRQRKKVTPLSECGEQKPKDKK